MSKRVPDFWPFSSDYYHTSGRAAQVRLVHIKAPAEAAPGSSVADARAFCGTHAYDVTNAPRLTHDPSQPLPAGLGWCPRCIGVAAFYLGVGDRASRLVAAQLTKRLRSVPTASELLAMDSS